VSAPAERLAPAELRTMFLFTDLDDEQLQWVADHGDVVDCPTGTEVTVEGEPAECFFVLLSGELSLVRLVSGGEIEMVRTDHPGVYCGATQFYFGDRISQKYASTARAVTDCRFLALPAEPFAEVFRAWYPMAVHLLEGLFLGLRNADELVGQRERLLALGKLTAGLTHELNNPAAAASRATSALRERFAGMRHKLALLADGRIDPAVLRGLTHLQEAFIGRIGDGGSLSAMERADLEDEVGDWLEDRGVGSPWELAGIFVAARLGTEDLERVADAVDASFLEPALRWLAYTVETETLLAEIMDSTSRVSALVDAARQYSQLDRTPHQQTDLREGLDATLVMMSAKMSPDVTVVKEYDPDLPRVPAYPGELNQVWTNLIHNAMDAMGGTGRLTLRTSRDGGSALVEVEDTGPGVPPELQRRIFEPFFTTKPVGQGTGLGLDVSYRIVVARHGGDLRVVSEPGRTCFQVRLPLSEGAPPRLEHPGAPPER
jgi:signal transduction histidine kinase